MRNIKLNKTILVIFISVFAVCIFMGGLINGEIEPLKVKGFFAFFYSTIPRLFGTAVGLPISGKAGRIFTFISSAVLLILSVKMTGFFKGDDSEDDFLGRILMYGLCYIFWTMASSAMIDQEFVYGFLINKILLIFPIIFAVSAFVITFLKFNKSQTLFWTRINFIMSSIGLSVSLAGFSSWIIDMKLEHVVVITSQIAEIFSGLAQVQVTSAIYGVILVFAQGSIALLAMFCIYIADEKIRVHYIMFGLVTLILFWAYSPHLEPGVLPKQLKYWLLLLVLLYVYTIQSKRVYKLSGIKTALSCLGIIICLPSLYYSIIFFYSPVNISLDMFFEKLIPMKTRAIGFINNIIPNEGSPLELNIIAMLAVTALIALVGFLLYLPPIKSSKDVEEENNPRYAILCAIVFLIGIIAKNCGFKNHIVQMIIYGIIDISSIAGIWVLGLSIKSKCKSGIISKLYVFSVTLMLCVPCSIFAQGIGIVLAGIALGIIAIKTIQDGLSSEESKSSLRAKQIYNAQAYHESIDQLNQQIESGEKSYSEAQQEAIAVAAIAIDTHESLQKSIDNLKKQ